MLKTSLGCYWRITWSFIIPVSLSLILTYALFDYKPITYNGFVLPFPAQVAGWLIVIFGVCLVPLIMFSQLCQNKNIFSPSISWGPAFQEDWSKWISGDQTDIQNHDSASAVSLEFNEEVHMFIEEESLEKIDIANHCQSQSFMPISSCDINHLSHES